MSAQPELFPHMNYWYSAKGNEIFLDLDSYRATSRALSVLRMAIMKKHLDVGAIWLYGTERKGHAHMIIELKQDMDWMTRLSWSIWMGNDRLRVAYILERENRGVQHSDLLTAKHAYQFRDPDAVCECKEKHKQPRVTSNCPAMKLLLGLERSADYFTRTGKAPPNRKIIIPWGRILIKDLKRWRGRYE
jgi:hypothetical protein